MLKLIKQSRYSQRMRKACKKWNRDRGTIILAYKNLSQKENPTFYWDQLVWQEIDMYIKIGEQAEKEDFDLIIKRRGFDKYMTNYLRKMIIYVGLGKNLKGEQ